MFNDNVEERYALAIERIKEIAEEPGLKTDGFADYFKCIAAFILKMDKLAADLKADVFRDYSLEEYKNLNTGLYELSGSPYRCSLPEKSLPCHRAPEMCHGENPCHFSCTGYRPVHG